VDDTNKCEGTFADFIEYYITVILGKLYIFNFNGLKVVNAFHHIFRLSTDYYYVGRGGALVKSMILNWKVVGSTSALAVT